MYRTFNMGTGFVAALSPEDADSLAEATDGRVIGHVVGAGEDETDEPHAGVGVSIRGLDL